MVLYNKSVSCQESLENGWLGNDFPFNTMEDE